VATVELYADLAQPVIRLLVSGMWRHIYQTRRIR